MICLQSALLAYCLACYSVSVGALNLVLVYAAFWSSSGAVLVTAVVCSLLASLRLGGLVVALGVGVVACRRRPFRLPFRLVVVARRPPPSPAPPVRPQIGYLIKPLRACLYSAKFINIYMCRSYLLPCWAGY